eukprot:COSAG02_NODE_341_length_24173_cov_28.504777_11_plen_162_part_00
MCRLRGELENTQTDVEFHSESRETQTDAEFHSESRETQTDVEFHSESRGTQTDAEFVHPSAKASQALKLLKLQLESVGISPPHGAEAWDFREFHELKNANVTLKKANDEKRAAMETQKREIEKLKKEVSGQAFAGYQNRMALSWKAREIEWQNTYGELAFL